MGDFDTQNISELNKSQLASQNHQSQKVFPCFLCNSLTHKIAECPLQNNAIEKKIEKALYKLR